MNDTLEMWLWIYGIFTVLWLIIPGGLWLENKQKWAARSVLVTPVWPLFVAVVIVRGIILVTFRTIRSLIKTAFPKDG